VNNIILIGMMGSGKTTIGRAISTRLGFDFFDSDQVIQDKCGASIADIFNMEGEQGFRKREADVIQDLCALSNIVLATGGGSIVLESNRAILQQRNACIIYLQANIETLWQRTHQDKNRPLLAQSNPKQILENLYALRHPIYAQMANYSIDTTKNTINQLVVQIVNILNK
jgi:shikimate kinase